MEGPKTNPVLGYRTAGSAAELETGELLAAEMRRIGLKMGISQGGYAVSGRSGKTV